MKIAVIYSSKYGSTEVCAKKISDNIKGESEIVNIKENNNINLGEYDKIVIGTSVYAGNIDKRIKDFCSKNEEILKSKVFGIFISCMNGSDLTKYVTSAF